MKGLIDRFAALDRPTALALMLQRAATDSSRLALAKAVARQTVAKRGVERARPTIMNVIKIVGEEIAEGVSRRRPAKKSDPAKASATANTAIRDRAEYIQVREEIEEIIRQSPERRTIEDEQLLERCREKFGADVTGRLFKEAKSAAIAAFSGTADAWNRGRPTKTSAPQKPPHPK